MNALQARNERRESRKYRENEVRIRMANPCHLELGGVFGIDNKKSRAEMSGFFIVAYCPVLK
jgi:hypothetical protein